MMQRPMGLGMMGRIQGTSEWANDPVWINDGWKERDGRDMTRSPPPGVHWVAGGKLRNGNKKDSYVTISNKD